MTSPDRLDLECDCELPGASLDVGRMPGHWLLARLGKRVLRPGGLGMTRQLLSVLAISPADQVVEFAPGLGVTARIALAAGPASYTAIERDVAAVGQVRRWLDRSPATGPRKVLAGLAQKTWLPEGCASVVYGEAMLSMQAEASKRQIVREACRLLKPGGRYGIHELCLFPDDLPERDLEVVRKDITEAIRHRALPLTGGEWEKLLQSEGFEIMHRSSAPMALLEPSRLVKDEGVLGAIRFIWRVLSDSAARTRVLAMRRTFRKHRNRMAAICLVARKPMGQQTVPELG